MIHRSKIEIIADILQCIMNDSTLSSSKVMYKSFQTYKQMKEYLPFLLQNELKVTITNKGLHFLEMYNMFPEFLNENR